MYDMIFLVSPCYTYREQGGKTKNELKPLILAPKTGVQRE